MRHVSALHFHNLNSPQYMHHYHCMLISNTNEKFQRRQQHAHIRLCHFPSHLNVSCTSDNAVDAGKHAN